MNHMYSQISRLLLILILFGCGDSSQEAATSEPAKLFPVVLQTDWYAHCLLYTSDAADE